MSDNNKDGPKMMALQPVKILIILFFVITCVSILCAQCNMNTSTRTGTEANTDIKFDTVYYKPVYAKGFEIIGMKGSKSRVIRVRSAWQGADSTALDLYISIDEHNETDRFNNNAPDCQKINGYANRIVAMSSSYIAMLDLLGKVDKVKGVSGIDFISNDYILLHRDSIADVGNEANVDFEKLAAIAPDIVILYGINSSSVMETKLKALKIPYIYMGEYLEPSPLGRAEWIMVIAELTGCREKGDAVFRQIETRYMTLKSLVPDSIPRPNVMLNTPYGDVWYMASKTSAMAAMIEDAGAEYVYKSDNSNKSLPVDMEEAYILASSADFWLNTGKIASLKELISAYPKFAGIKSIKDRNVYNCDKRTSADKNTSYKGNDFWESGQVRPDLVLEDLIRIFHPELISGRSIDIDESNLFYYRKLE